MLTGGSRIALEYQFDRLQQIVSAERLVQVRVRLDVRLGSITVHVQADHPGAGESLAQSQRPVALCRTHRTVVEDHLRGEALRLEHAIRIREGSGHLSRFP